MFIAPEGKGNSRPPALSQRRSGLAVQRPSLVRRELERAARGGGGALVAPRSKFHPAVHDPEIQPVDQPAIAALLAKILHPRPRPFAIRDDVVDDAFGHGRLVTSSK